MSRLALYAGAAGGVFRRDVALFLSYRMRFVTTIFATVVTLTLFYYVSRLVHSDRFGSPDGYYAFVVVGIVVMSLLTSTLSMPIGTLRSELLAGTFERMVLSPFGAVRSIASLLLFPLALSFVTATASLAYASLAFGLRLRWPEVLAGVPVAALGALAFAPFGLLMTAAVVLFKQTNAGATFVVTGVTLLAGAYFPVSLLPAWIRWASDVQPFTPGVDLLRDLVVGTPLPDPALVDLAKLVGFPLVMLPLALYALGRAVRHGRRRGTIIEY
jgi:ABC-2 type transport system permease protein